MGKHRGREGRRWGLFGRREEIDNLFARSFQSCLGCGADVYVLATDCRECGQVLELATT